MCNALSAAGHGSATVILLHGFAETSRMWRPIIPSLAEKFTVIAPDLPALVTLRFQQDWHAHRGAADP